MGKLYDEIDDKLAAWLVAQPLLFVATAPLGADGHVNVSPKGMGGTFAVLGPRQVGYLDYFGSGVETIAHLRENGRIVMMACAFHGPPKIVRLHGRNADTWDARTGAASDRFKYLYGDAELEEWVPHVRELAHQTHAVHVLFNNNYEDWGMRNARRMGQLLGLEAGPAQAQLDLAGE